MSEILTKLKSDRLWTMIAYASLVLANHFTDLDIPQQSLSEIGYVVIVFVLGKSFRGSLGAATINAVPTLLKMAVPVKEADPHDDDGTASQPEKP